MLFVECRIVSVIVAALLIEGLLGSLLVDDPEMCAAL